MDCPLQTQEGRELLLDYCGGRGNGDAAAALERHAETCTACSRFVREQRAVTAALDAWTAAPVPPDFDRRLYQRIEQRQRSWREALAGWAPAAAAACVLITAGILIHHPKPSPAGPDTALVDAQPDQVEAALDALETLSEFAVNSHIE